VFWPFTDEALAAYEAAFRNRKPAAPDVQAREAAPQPCSAALSFSNAGVCIRFAMEDGSSLDLFLNPYVARELACSTFQEGERAGWLDEDVNFRTSPTYCA